MHSVAWNPAGTRIVSGGAGDQTLRIWSGASFYKDRPRRNRKDLDLSKKTSICREVARAWQAGDVSLAWHNLGQMCDAPWVSELLEALDANGAADAETPEKTDKDRERSKDIRAAIEKHLAQEQGADSETPPPLEDSVKALRELIEIDAGDQAIAWLVDSACKLVESGDDASRPLRVALLGEFSSGKSRLINALLGEKTLLSVGRVPVTRSVTRLVHARELSTTVRHADGSEVKVAPEELGAYVDERNRKEGAPDVDEVVVGHPSPLLASVELLDTPGFGSGNQLHDQVAAQLVNEADAVLWILAPHQVGTRTERGLLDMVSRAQGKVVVVLNQIDTLEGSEQVERQRAAAHQYYAGSIEEVIPTSAKWLEQDGEHPGGELKFNDGVVAGGAGANRKGLMAAITKIGSWNKERRMRRFARRAAAAADQARAYLALKAAEDKVHATYGDKVEKSRAKQRKQALDLWKEALQHRDEVHQVRADAKDHWFESHCAHRRPLAAAYETLWKGDLDRAEAHALLACLHTLEEVHWHLSPYDPTPWREDFLLSVTKGMEHASLIQPPVTLFSDEFLSPQSCLKDLLVLLLEQDRLSARLTSSPNPRRTIHSDTGPTLMVGDWAATTRPEAGFGAIMGQGIDEKGTATTDGQLIWRERWTGMKRSCKDK